MDKIGHVLRLVRFLSDFVQALKSDTQKSLVRFYLSSNLPENRTLSRKSDTLSDFSGLPMVSPTPPSGALKGPAVKCPIFWEPSGTDGTMRRSGFMGASPQAPEDTGRWSMAGNCCHLPQGNTLATTVSEGGRR